MKIDLYSLLPRIWKLLDKEGIEKRFLGIFSRRYDDLYKLIESVYKLRNLNQIDDAYLELLLELLGYRWRGRSSRKNRNRARNAIKEYSNKGSQQYYYNIFREWEVGAGEITDQASKLLILSKGQGRLSREDCGIPDADYLNDGVYLWNIDKTAENELAIQEVLEDWPAGTRLLFTLSSQYFFSSSNRIELWYKTQQNVDNRKGRLNDTPLGDLFLSFNPGNVKIQDTGRSYLLYGSYAGIENISVTHVDNRNGRLSDAPLGRLQASPFPGNITIEDTGNVYFPPTPPKGFTQPIHLYSDNRIGRLGETTLGELRISFTPGYQYIETSS